MQRISILQLYTLLKYIHTSPSFLTSLLPSFLPSLPYPMPYIVVLSYTPVSSLWNAKNWLCPAVERLEV